MWTDFYSTFSQSTRLTDRQTDRILIARPRLHFMQHGNNKSLMVCSAVLTRIVSVLYITYINVAVGICNL